MKLNLGLSISLPINNIIIPKEYIDELKNKENFNSLQIMFTKNKLSDEEIENIAYFIKKINYKHIYIHASYQINIGTEPLIQQNELYNPGLEIFINEIIYSLKINANGIIIHMGKNVKNKYETDNVYNNMVNFVIQTFETLKRKKLYDKLNNFVILFETPAGQGGEMCVNIHELVNFIELFKSLDFYKHIGICIDTCHIFQAGHDINNNNVIKDIHKTLKPIMNKIHAIHLNDSYHTVGKRIDRHEKIGYGNINVDKLIKFILPFKKIPLILETRPPYENQISKLLNN